MIILLCFILAILVIHTFFIIAIANAVYKLIESDKSEEKQLVGIPFGPSYADNLPNYDGITPQPSNWDGVPK